MGGSDRGRLPVRPARQRRRGPCAIRGGTGRFIRPAGLFRAGRLWRLDLCAGLCRQARDRQSQRTRPAQRQVVRAAGMLALRGRLAWAHDFNPDRSAAASFLALPGASFAVSSATQARDSALSTSSVEMTWAGGWSAAASFEGEFSRSTRAYAGKASRASPGEPGQRTAVITIDLIGALWPRGEGERMLMRGSNRSHERDCPCPTPSNS